MVVSIGDYDNNSEDLQQSERTATKANKLKLKRLGKNKKKLMVNSSKLGPSKAEFHGLF